MSDAPRTCEPFPGFDAYLAEGAEIQAVIVSFSPEDSEWLARLWPNLEAVVDGQEASAWAYAPTITEAIYAAVDALDEGEEA